MTFLIDNWQQVLRESLVPCSRISVLMQSCFIHLNLVIFWYLSVTFHPPGLHFLLPLFSFIILFDLLRFPSVIYVTLSCASFTSSDFVTCSFIYTISTSMTRVEFRQLPTPSASSAVSTLGLSAHRWIVWFMSKRGTNRRSPSFTNPAAFFRRRGDALRPEV